MTRTWWRLTALAAALLLVGLALLGWTAVQRSSGWFGYAPLAEASFRMVWVSPWLSVLGWALTGVGSAALCVLLSSRGRRRRAGRR